MDMSDATEETYHHWPRLSLLESPLPKHKLKQVLIGQLQDQGPSRPCEKGFMDLEHIQMTGTGPQCPGLMSTFFFFSRFQKL